MASTFSPPSLVGGTNQDATTVIGVGIAPETMLVLNAGAGVDTLNYDAGGLTPTVIAGRLPGDDLLASLDGTTTKRSYCEIDSVASAIRVGFGINPSARNASAMRR